MSGINSIEYLQKHPSETLLDRFWSKVKKTSRCWLWTGAVVSQRGGYGVIHLDRNNSATHVHRLSYILHCGNIPSGYCVCHKCDTPSCVRPSHLFIGTHADNLADMRAKGRHAHGRTHGSYTHPECWARGEKVGSARLKKSQVRKILKLYYSGRYTQRDLGKIFNVNPRGAIWWIVHRKSWKHLF